MLGFIEKCFFTGLIFFSTLTSVNFLSCISMNNQECKVRQQLLILIVTNLCFFLLVLKQVNAEVVATILITHMQISVSDFVKSLNVKVFNLMSRTNETRHIEWHETCKCKCRLDASAYNNRQRWNYGKCRCECKELIDKVVCDKGSNWNPSNCDCEYGKSCDVGEYSGYENCKCRKKLVDKLVEECAENIDKVKIAGMALFENGNECVCSYAICVVLAVIALTISIGIGAYSAYKYMNHGKTDGKKSFNHQTILPY